MHEDRPGPLIQRRRKERIRPRCRFRRLDHQCALADLAADADLPMPEQARRMWRRLADPAMWPHERLFFEVYGQALQGRAHTTALLDGIVDSTLEPLTALTIAHGLPPDRARASARLGIAVTRGLLLDLLATGDRAGVDAAMELFIEMYERLTAT